MSKRELMRSASFLVLAALLFQLLTVICIPKWYGTWQSTRIVDGFYELPDNSVDVVFLGSSQTIMGLSPMELYAQYGISAYAFGTEEQPLYATYYWLREILRTQKPMAAVLDINELLHENSEASYRKAFDYMHWSGVKWEAVKNHCEGDPTLSLLNYVLPLGNYHSRWEELESQDFTYLTRDKTDPCLGFVASSGTCEIPYEGTEPEPEMEPETPAPEAALYLEKIIRLCQDQGISLILVKTPRAGWNSGKHNLASQTAQDYHIPFLDFNDPKLLEEMDFSYANDARDASHLNIYGAEKLGAYLGRYLFTQYEIPDRRGDPLYAHLEQLLPVYERKAANAKLATCTEFTSWLELLPKNCVLVFATDSSVAFSMLPKPVQEQLGWLGLDLTICTAGIEYAAVLNPWAGASGSEGEGNSQILAWQAGIGITDLYGSLPDGSAYELSLSRPQSEEEPYAYSMKINHGEYAAAGAGIHLLVYDPAEKAVIDSICVDPGKPGLLVER